MLVDKLDLLDLDKVVQIMVEDLIVLLVEMEQQMLVDLMMVLQLLLVI